MNLQRRTGQRRVDDKIRSNLDLLFNTQTTLEAKNDELRDVRQELKEMRQALIELHESYAELFEFSPAGCMLLDKIGNIQSINLTAATLLGKDQAALISKPFTDCIPHAEHQTFLSFLKKIFSASGKTTIELKINDAHNQINNISLESFLKRGSTRHNFIIITDITQITRISKQNHELLAGNRKLIKNLFEVQEKERHLLARELHDELGQWITAISTDNEVVLSGAQAILESTQKMHMVLHGMLKKLRPDLLDELGLEDALMELKCQWCKHHRPINLEFKLEGTLENLGETFNVSVFRIIQEGLNNIGS